VSIAPSFRCGITIGELPSIESDAILIDPNRPVLPSPQKLFYSSNYFKLAFTKENPLKIDVYNVEVPERITYHLKELLLYKNAFPIDIEYFPYPTPPHPERIIPFIQSFENISPPIKKQAYVIEIVDNFIRIWADSDIGLYYGLTTLSQLIHENQKHWVVQASLIIDYPTYELRGTTDQVCHGQVPTVNTIKRLIRFLSRYKKNLLGLNLEDIMGFDKYPNIGKWRGAYTKEEIKEMQDYARLYYIDLFPGFQALGHLENFLYYPEFRDLAEFPGANSLNLANPRSFQVLEEWYREICDKFSPKIVHIEMDEAYDYGIYASKALIAQKGRAEVLLEHIRKVHHLLHDELRKDVFMYHDTIMTEKSILDKLPKDIKIIFWNYTPLVNWKSLQNLINAGFFVFVSPAIANWSRPYPELLKAYSNIQNMAMKGIKYGARGFMNSMWGDFSNENLHETIYLGLAIGADFAWNPDGHNLNLFQRSFGEDFLGMHNPHLFWDTIALLTSLNKGSVFNTPFFIRLWEHPFGLQSPTYPRKDAKNAIKTMILTQEHLAACKNTVTRNVDLLDYIQYAIDINLFNANKALLGHQIFQWGKKDRLIRPQLLSELQKIQQDLDSLWNRYQTLWLRCAKPEGLERIEKNYHALKNVYSALIECCRNRLPYRTPYLISEWITHPTTVNNQTPYYFRKRFSLPSKQYNSIRYARVQAIANTYLKISINGHLLGEVISRFYLSPVIFDNAVKVFDFQPYLQESENFFEIEAYEYSYSLITINIFGEIVFHDDTALRLPSNCTWAVSDVQKQKWVPALSLGIPPKINGEIWKPDLFKNEPSWISRKFGEKGYKQSIIYMATKSRFLARLLSRF
jgi:hypothetical protein